MFEVALELLTKGGPLAAVDFLAAQAPGAEAVDAYAKLITKAYWQQKDLGAVVILASAGVQLALGTAKFLEGSDPDTSVKLARAAKAMLYNLASFTWDGWDEPGIPIGAIERRIGLDAAKANLHLSLRLERPESKLRRDYWMLGVHQISCGDHAGARENLAKSAEHAKNDGARAEELLALGFLSLVDQLTEPQEPSHLESWARVREELLTLAHGSDFIGQVETAGTVFRAKD